VIRLDEGRAAWALSPTAAPRMAGLAIYVMSLLEIGTKRGVTSLRILSKFGIARAFSGTSLIK